MAAESIGAYDAGGFHNGWNKKKRRWTGKIVRERRERREEEDIECI